MLFVMIMLVWLIVAPTIIVADCPDFSFRCPSGETFSVNTCWSWREWHCYTCRNINDELERRCPQYSCFGSVRHWYGRSDGCSGELLAWPLTKVFRASCTIHDICYATPGRDGESSTKTKRRCDDDFYHNMRQTCTFPGIGSIGYGVCSAAARIVYEVVKISGNTFPDFARNWRMV